MNSGLLLTSGSTGRSFWVMQRQLTAATSEGGTTQPRATSSASHAAPVISASATQGAELYIRRPRLNRPGRDDRRGGDGRLE